jgi:hypothetical protein
MNAKHRIRSFIPYILFTLFSFWALIVAVCCLIFIPTFSISISLFYLFISLSFLLMFFGGGLEIINVRIKSKFLILRCIYGLGYNKYAYSEIVGFKSLIRKNKKGEFTCILIKTSSEKVIEINGFFISNISEIENELSKIVYYDNSIIEPIFNLKDKLFLSVTIFFLICFLCFIISL